MIPSIFLDSFEYTRVALLNKRSTAALDAGQPRTWRAILEMVGHSDSCDLHQPNKSIEMSTSSLFNRQISFPFSFRSLLHYDLFSWSAAQESIVVYLRISAQVLSELPNLARLAPTGKTFGSPPRGSSGIQGRPPTPTGIRLLPPDPHGGSGLGESPQRGTCLLMLSATQHLQVSPLPCPICS